MSYALVLVLLVLFALGLSQLRQMYRRGDRIYSVLLMFTWYSMLTWMIVTAVRAQ